MFGFPWLSIGFCFAADLHTHTIAQPNGLPSGLAIGHYYPGLSLLAGFALGLFPRILNIVLGAFLFSLAVDICIFISIFHTSSWLGMLSGTAPPPSLGPVLGHSYQHVTLWSLAALRPAPSHSPKPPQMIPCPAVAGLGGMAFWYLCRHPGECGAVDSKWASRAVSNCIQPQWEKLQTAERASSLVRLVPRFRVGGGQGPLWLGDRYPHGIETSCLWFCWVTACPKLSC